MKHLILKNTPFFRLIEMTDSPDYSNIQNDYVDFVSEVITLCHESADCGNLAYFALLFTEIELQYHPQLDRGDLREVPDIYIRKALDFVRRMIKSMGCGPSAHPLREDTGKTAPALQWTGNTVDLVELIYGINEMGCINDGTMPLKQLAPLLYGMFGIKAKDCYRFYVDIKRRKSGSRTYFLDRMREKLNRRMDMDEERERTRR